MFDRLTRAGLGALALSLLVISGANAESWQIARSSGPVWFGSGGAELVSLGSTKDIPGGATLVTGVGGRAMLIRGAQTMLVGPSAVVIVPDEDKEGITTILQRAGEVTFDVDRQPTQHFAVETPFLAAVVKGTHFKVAIDYAHAEVAVERGLVEVTDLATGDKVDTAAGQHALVAGSGAPLLISGSGTLASIVPGQSRQPLVAPISDDEMQSLQEKARTGDGSGIQEVRSEEAGLAVIAGNGGSTGGSGGTGGSTGGPQTGGTGTDAGQGTNVAMNGDGIAAGFEIESKNLSSYTGAPRERVARKQEVFSPLTFAMGAAVLTLLAIGFAYIRERTLR